MKKYKYLVVNGCSYVQGVGCENAKEDRFSKLLSDKLQCKEINLSKSGGSNDRMIRVTYQWVKENIDKVDETLFIMGFTELFRMDLYSNVYKSFIRGSEMFKKNSSSLAERIGCGKDELQQYSEFLLKYLINGDILLDRLIQQSELLNSFIGNKARVIFFSSILGVGYKQVNNINNMKEAPINTFSVEDMKNIEFFKIDNHDNWKRFIESNDEEYSGGHPTSEHNKILSDKLYEYINA